jgi:prenyltransferase beta subunit
MYKYFKLSRQFKHKSHIYNTVFMIRYLKFLDKYDQEKSIENMWIKKFINIILIKIL